MELVVAGISHRTAPLELREKAALDECARHALLADLAADPRVHEAIALSTCNRTELYAAVRSREEGARALSAAHARHTRVGAHELTRVRYVLAGTEAVEHLLRVAASLDSMVLGESEIQGQVRAALAHGDQAGTVGRELRDLFRRALVTGKRVRRVTGIGRGAVSASRAAVELAADAMSGLHDRRALLIGAGRAAEASGHALVKHGVRQPVVLNRSQPNAQCLARALGGRAATLGALDRELAAADLVVCSTGSPLPLVTAAAVERALAGRSDRPLVLIDLAVPRDVEPAVRDITGAVVFDVDDLDAAVREHHDERLREAARAEQIVRDEVDRHLRRRELPAIASCAA